MRREGVYIMTVALNKRYTDFRVLRALASPTKTDHVIRTPNSTTAYEISIPTIARLIESGPNCDLQYADIAILVETKKQNFLRFESVKTFLNQLYNIGSNLKIRMRFLNLPKPRWSCCFKLYSENTFQKQVFRLGSVFDQSMQPYQSITKRIQKAVNYEMNEDFGSTSRFKVLIVITEDPITTEDLRQVDHAYREDKTVINISQNAATKLPEPSGTSLGNNLNFAHFTFDKGETILAYIKASEGNVPCM